jgi:hypothetical protein
MVVPEQTAIPPKSRKKKGDLLIPTPLATGGLGFFLALFSPGGWSGGTGFLVGMLVGFALILLFPLIQVIQETYLTRRSENTRYYAGGGNG